MSRFIIVLAVAAVFYVINTVPVQAQSDGERLLESYRTAVTTFENIAIKNGVVLADGEQIRDVVAFAINNVTRNNFVPVSIAAEQSKLLEPEFTSFLAIWSWMPVMPKAPEQRAAFLKARGILSRNQYEVSLASLAAENLAAVASPSVYGRQYEFVSADIKTRSFEEFAVPSLVAAMQEAEQPAMVPSFYQGIRRRLESGEVKYDNLLDFDAINGLDNR